MQPEIDAQAAECVDGAAVREIVAFLGKLSDGDFAHRVPPRAEPLTRALFDGANALADRMETERRENDLRTHARSLELDQLHNDVTRLSEFGNLMQACEDISEAYEVIEHEVSLLFPGLAGALYLFNASRNVLELKASWGDLSLDTSLPRENCWALRRGQQHLVFAHSPRLSCKHTLERWGDSICYPMSAQGEILGMLHLMGRRLQDPAHVLLTASKQRLCIAMAEQTALSLANLRMRDTLGQQALRDPLTGLYNRRFVDESLIRETARADRRGASLGILMIDIDHFKRYNDLHGHGAGDAILSAVASAVQNCVRADDIACRYGGEELLVLLYDVDEDALLARADELRTTVAATTVPYNGAHLPPVTISLGAALYPDHGTRPIDVLRIADAALYSAKEGGRNQTVIAPLTDRSVSSSLAIVD